MQAHPRPAATPARRLTTGLAAVVLAVALAACGSGGSSGPATGGTAAGDPIKVMVQAPVKSQGANNDGIPNALNVGKAYEAWINGKGGINGRPLEVITCDDHRVTADSVNCAREALDEKVIAAVGGTSYSAPNVVPVYEKGKTAWFGAACNLAADEFTSPVSFPTATCSISVIAGNVVGLALTGCKNVSFTNYALDIAEFQAKIVNNSGASMGLTSVKTVTLPSLNEPDITPYVARTSDGTDCLFAGSLTSPASFQQWMTAWRQQGKTQRLAFNAGIVADQIPAYAKEMEGGIVANTTSDLALPVWDDYRAATKAAGVPAGDNSRAQVTWASLVAFTKIVEKMTGPVTNETFLDAASKTSDLTMDGLQADLDFTKTYTGLGGGYPRMFNRQVAFSIITNGTLGAFENGRFFDVTPALEGTPFPKQT